MAAGRVATIVLVVLGLGFAALAREVRRSYAADGRRSRVLVAVAGSIGMCSLALSREGGGTREPLEGPAGCLGDVPGGYCIREPCDVIACPGGAVRPRAFTVARTVR